MLLTQESLRPSGDAVAAQPLCPNCGRPMHLARTTPRTGGLSDLQTFRCGECGVAVTRSGRQ